MKIQWKHLRINKQYRKHCRRDPWVAQRFGTACSLGCDPGDPGSSPASGSLHGAYFSLCLCLCLPLSLSVSHE